jgi:hypothetical protein
VRGGWDGCFELKHDETMVQLGEDRLPQPLPSGEDWQGQGRWPDAGCCAIRWIKGFEKVSWTADAAWEAQWNVRWFGPRSYAGLEGSDELAS